MFRLTGIIAILGLVFAPAAEPQELKKAKKYETIKASIVKKIVLPRWYHEGLFWDGKNIWVSNGKDGKTWVVDTAAGSIVREITPVAGFTEAVIKKSNEEYFVTDWDEMKLYKVMIENDRMLSWSEMSFAPAHPAGCIFIGARLFIITWTRGFGTKFDLVEMDDGMNIVRKTRIKDIQEPAHMAWDGRYLWVTSWFYRDVYKVDMDRLEIVGQFESPVEKTTGIAWDGRYFWITGTYADLYQIELSG